MMNTLAQGHEITSPASALDELTQRIIAYAFTVSNNLGSGFVEKVYENALAHELTKVGLKVSQQHPVKVLYDNVIVGEFTADMLVEDKVIVELKAVSELNVENMAQALNYLRASGLPSCLLINFGKSKIQIRRLHPSPSWKKPKS